MSATVLAVKKTLNILFTLDTFIRHSLRCGSHCICGCLCVRYQRAPKTRVRCDDVSIWLVLVWSIPPVSVFACTLLAGLWLWLWLGRLKWQPRPPKPSTDARKTFAWSKYLLECVCTKAVRRILLSPLSLVLEGFGDFVGAARALQ